MIDKDKLKPFLLLFVCMIASCLYFWTSSRYPDLGAKATLGGSAPLSGLGFAPLYDIAPDAPVWEKLFYGTINWLETNRRGMSFAFVLGAFFLSMFPLFRRRRVKSGVGNAGIGLLMGLPLGLCVNCSAPVARSMQAGGMRLEAALALLISSPTMNVIVLGMAFTFFPLYLVLGKIALTLLIVLVIVPFALKHLFKKEMQNQGEMIESAEQNCADDKGCTVPEIKGWGHAIVWSITAYIKNFVRIILITGPLMILAGFIGTVLINFLPWEQIKALSGPIENPLTVLGIMGLIAIVGALLPAPMAFDVAMSAFLLQAGVPIAYVAVFLFTLGAYSIYAFFIVWQAVSLRVAGFLMGITILAGLFLGGITFAYEAYYTNKVIQDTANISGDLDPIVDRHDQAMSFTKISEELNKVKKTYKPLLAKDGMRVEFSAYETAHETENEPKAFTRVLGDNLGITQPYEISYIRGIDYIPLITTSIASGDVHQDGREDLLILGDHEVSPNVVLFSNIGGEKFIRQEIPAASNAILVALADVSGDGWLDIVYATHGGKNFVIYNDKGDFREENRKQLGPDLKGMSNNISFGDLNKDGKLEVFLGNWSVGPQFLNAPNSRDMVLRREGEGFKSAEVSGLTGEALTSMIFDFNQDGNQDVFVGNDYIMGNRSDLILLGDGKGGLNLPDPEFSSKYKSGQSTMSIDVADVDNDLEPEFFIGHIAFMGQYMKKMSQISKRQIPYSFLCDKESDLNQSVCKDEAAFKFALARVHNFIKDACEGLTNPVFKQKCEVHVRDYETYCAGQNQRFVSDPSALIDNTRYRAACRKMQLAYQAEFEHPPSEEDKSRHIKIANESRGNILLKRGKDGSYSDEANAKAISYGGWTWNARFADLDNDGLQDLYVTNGYSTTMTLGTKILYKNKGEGAFEDVTVPYGLEDYSITSAYSYVDYDADGDLDIVAVPLDGPVRIFRNNAGTKEQSIQIELRDDTSENVQAIGAKVVVGKQTRYILASGGYKSFNPAMVHFGLGKTDKVEKIEIVWPDGKQSILDGNFAAGGRYRITRER